MINSPENDLQAAVALLQAELTRLRDGSGEAWRNYLGWFTWFFTTQVLVASWVVTKAPGLSGIVDTIVLAAAFIILNVLGITQAMRQRAYCVLQKDRADVVCAQLRACAEKSGLTLEITSGFGSDLVDSALKLFIAALFTGIIMWLYVVIRHSFS